MRQLDRYIGKTVLMSILLVLVVIVGLDGIAAGGSDLNTIVAGGFKFFNRPQVMIRIG